MVLLVRERHAVSVGAQRTTCTGEDTAVGTAGSGASREPCNLTPHRITVSQHRTIARRGPHVSAGAEVAADGFNASKEALRLLGGCEALPRAFAATSGPMGGFGAVVQPLVAAVLDPRQHPADGRWVAGECVGTHDTGRGAAAS